MHDDFVKYEMPLDRSVSISTFLTSDGVEQDIQIITTMSKKRKLMQREGNLIKVGKANTCL